MDGGVTLYPRAHRLQAREPADFLALARGAWSGEAYRLGPGPFAFDALRIALEPGLCLDAWTCEGAVRARVTLASDALHLAFIAGDGLRVRGWRMDGEALAVTPGGAAFETAIRGQARATGLCIKGPLLESLRALPGVAATLAGWQTRARGATVLLPSTGAAARQLRARLGAVLEGRNAVGNAPPMVADAARDALLHDARDALAEGLALPDPHMLQPGRRRHALARAAEELIWSRVRAPDAGDTSLDALCAALGTTRRTLQLAFQEHFGVNHGLVTRAARLHRVRAELRERGASVSDTAFRHGFEHLGRFAGYYRAFYGENPSATRRARPR